MQPRLNAARQWVVDHRWPLALWLLAFAIRAHWNLEIHPPHEYVYSDMAGYVRRAEQLLEHPYKPNRYAAFFPFGTHWMIAVVKYWFGHTAHAALGLCYALVGSLVVPLSYAIARRVEVGEQVAKISAAILTVYYPLISLGGYTLSEIPACMTLCLSVWCMSQVLHRAGDPQSSSKGTAAWSLALGLSLGVACAVRTQIVMNIALVAAFLLLLLRTRPAKLASLRWVHVGCAALPLALCLGLSAYRVKHHAGHWGLISENGPINLIFGRCHTTGVSAQGKHGGWGHFGPPPIIQLHSHGYRNPDSWMRLRPVFADDPSPVPEVPGFVINGPIACKNGCKSPGIDVQYNGYIGDTEIQNKIVKACLERSSWTRQLIYSMQHIVLLWDFNLTWPDSANPKPRPRDRRQSWNALTQRWRYIHNIGLTFPALLAAAVALRSPTKRPQATLVALNFVSVLVVAALVMGGQRFRAPYDPLIIILAVCFWDGLYRWYRSRTRS